MNFKGIEICCPHCKQDLVELSDGETRLVCSACDREYPVVLGIPDLRVFPDPYIDIESDRTKGKGIAAQFGDTDFAGLIDYYYSTTDVVPPQHVQLYKRGLLAGVPRATAALAAWESSVAGPKAESLLDLGCGTGPMLVAASKSFGRLVGVDIAFRWLMVGRKRLDEAGLDIPLICACAEALPFPDGVFDRVVAESVVEHVRDQETTFAEAHRVMRASAWLFLSTPNRYSLGPDPQVGIWAGGYLPKRWLDAYVRRQGGIPPKRQLLSAGRLRDRLDRAGFETPTVSLPDIPEGQRARFGRGMRLMIQLYHIAKRLPITRSLLLWIGPLLNARVQKPGTTPDAGS